MLLARASSLARAARGADISGWAAQLLELKEDKKTFEFADIAEEPVLSVLRGYSAPVKLEFDRSEEELAFLMGHDDDSFNRWEAGQTLFTRAILANVAAFQAGNKMGLSDALVEAVRLTLAGKDIEKSLQAMTLTLPSLKALAEELDVVDVDALVLAGPRALSINLSSLA